MTSANSRIARDILSRSASVIVGQTDEERAERLASVIAALRGGPARLVRVANPLEARLSLSRILIQISPTEVDGTTESDTARLLQVLRRQEGGETHILLIVEQAETLESEALFAIRTAVEALKGQVPAAHVLFVGSPAILDLGITSKPPGTILPESRLRLSEGEDPTSGSTHAEPTSAPLRWQNTLARAVLAAGPLGLMLAWSYPGAPLRGSLASDATNSTYVFAHPGSFRSHSATVQTQPAARADAFSTVEAERARTVRLREDFEQFLNSSGWMTARLTPSQRNTLFQEYLSWRSRQPDKHSS